jgi:hypothetical protein
LGSQLYALEHTGIEPFEDHVRLEAEAQRHFDPIKEALIGVVPNGVLELQVPVRAMLKRPKAEVAKIQAALVGWIRREGPTLRTSRYADYGGNTQWVTVPGVPFQVRLVRFARLVPGEGRFQIVHMVQGDLDRERTDRLSRTCDRKFPKLAAWKRKRGARTILVLEENDIQLTNYAIVADTYFPLAQSRDDRPDETYLVSTCTEPWYVWPLLIGNKTLYELAVDDYVPRWEVEPISLTPVKVR